MQHFNEMNLPASLQASLSALEFTQPTPIQAQTIPSALEGSDVLGSAQTGTGKTLAFAVPLVSYVLNNPTESALVLTPTRELAQQVFKSICALIPKNERTYASLLIGGESFSKQVSQLRRNPRIMVATPGRMIDHLEQGTVEGEPFSFLVLDETDRMFDMGFSMQLEDIIKRLPKKRQTLMFSATIAPEIEALTKKYLSNPVRISVDSVNQPIPAVTQETINLKETEKYTRLLTELTEREGSVIVFVKTKRSAEILADNLHQDGHEAECIHGDLRQNKRERVMTAFRKGRYRIMVATDVAARGLDVPHIKLVVNYDLPQCPEDYIHRIGRTGRAGAEGSAINFVAGHDRRNWDAIQRLMNPGKSQERAPFGYQGERRRSNSGSGDFRSSSRRDSGSRDRDSDRRGGSSFGGARRSSNNSSFGSSTRSSDSDSDSRGGRPSFRKSSNSDSSSSFGGGNSSSKPRSRNSDFGGSSNGGQRRSSSRSNSY